jgi:hypothetical protein
MRVPAWSDGARSSQCLHVSRHHKPSFAHDEFVFFDEAITRFGGHFWSDAGDGHAAPPDSCRM